jgi:hypothetical protein
MQRNHHINADAIAAAALRGIIIGNNDLICS